jgi:hypothetical protein
MSEAAKRRIALTGKLLAALVVALPGAYAAIRSGSAAGEAEVATVESRARIEARVRDHQEADLQKHVAALAAEVAALRTSVVTHRDLVDLVLKLRAPARERRVARTERERALGRRLADLRVQGAVADVAVVAAKVTKAALPRLRPAAKVRAAARAAAKEL